MLNAVVRDYRVSWRARGLLTELLSYPENYETSVDELVKKAKRSGGNVEGRDAMRKAARELKAVGYIVERRYQNDLGRWTTEHEITDDPMYDLLAGDNVSAGHTDDGFSGVGKPVVGKSGVIKKTEKKILLPSFSKAVPSEADPAGREGEEPNDETLKRAQSLVDDAVRLWPKEHRAPSARDRQRLSDRVASELANGGDDTVIVHEISRDLHDADSAIRVVLGSRTQNSGWGQVTDPRPGASTGEWSWESQRRGERRHRNGVVGGSRMPVPDHTYWANITPEQLKNIL